MRRPEFPDGVFLCRCVSETRLVFSNTLSIIKLCDILSDPKESDSFYLYLNYAAGSAAFIHFQNRTL